MTIGPKGLIGGSYLFFSVPGHGFFSLSPWNATLNPSQRSLELSCASTAETAPQPTNHPRLGLGGGSEMIWVSLVFFQHHPTIRYMVYNGYYKVMSNIPKMGQLPTPVFFGPRSRHRKTIEKNVGHRNLWRNVIHLGMFRGHHTKPEKCWIRL